MIFVLLPAYNEAESIPLLLEELDTVLAEMGEDARVLICDDGSRDGTPDIIRAQKTRVPVEILTHRLNRGLGETSRDLFEAAAERCTDDDIIVRMDCDVTHKPKFIPDLVAKIREGYDVVIASRFLPGGGQVGVDGYRAFISSCANWFMKLVFPIKGLREYSCGFRAYRGALIRRAITFYGNSFIQLKGLGFTCTLEKLVKLKLLGARFAEVPFVLRYDEKRSASKMVSSITTLGYITMAICYHWPWGGWRRSYYRRAANFTIPTDTIHNEG